MTTSRPRASSAPAAPLVSETQGGGSPGAAGGAARSGLAFAVGAYGLWGVLPVFFLLMSPSGPFEIVAWRIVFSLVFCLALLAATRGFPAFVRLLRQPRLVATMGLAGVFIVVNWTVFITAALAGHVVEAALGYFINPIVTVLLAVVVLRERLRPAQWAAVALSGVAVLVIAIGTGDVPWVSLVLASSFGLYGLVKKQVGGRVDAIGGLTLETMLMTPVAGAALVVMAVTGVGGGVVFGSVSVVHTLTVISSGVVTAVPLLLFAAAARRLPLATIGLTQYLAPVLQLIVGVVLLHEEMPVTRWIGFAIVWVALIVLSTDAVRSSRRNRGIERKSRIANETVQ
ncbi:EamA family transporter RarD [Frigoribacterium faeni]|uniref:EamA family transporter RarD n=1 Tax=Frigoribacterium TaxID=96492 RepID=UPI001786AB68|nr:EamA family transporter RarD [Frigoribacterium faeni]MBD8704214.1 EamA family transporter RarD [Frigoribacterium sp. CFBP 13712]MCJ0701417.1 EamA family transporter RarD [Frigoribacterium faeni]